MASQIFRYIPDIEFTNRVIACYNLIDINDKTEFSKTNLITNNTVEKLNNLLPELIVCYFPCQAKVYLREINEQRCITILRHFLKIFNYIILRRECFINKKKTTFYRISSKKNINNITDIMVLRKKIVLNFG